jgi:hypothetical protein
MLMRLKPIRRRRMMINHQLLEELLGPGRYMTEAYAITENDSSIDNGKYYALPLTAYFFNWESEFAIYEPAYDFEELVKVRIVSPQYSLYLVAEKYADVLEFRDMIKVHRLKTEAVLLPGSYLELPKHQRFFLTCVRVMKLSDE